MARKRQDPRLLALLERERKEQERFNRWYSKLKRAFTEVERCRQAITRVQRRIRQLEEVNATANTPA